MPITVTFDAQRRLIRFTLVGTLETAEMLNAVKSVLAETDGTDGHDVLSDHRELLTPATPEQVRALLDFLARNGNAVRGGRCAVVVNSEASYGMIRMMAARAETLGIEVRPFWKIEDAESFLASRR